MAENSKQQEALKDAEIIAPPPPTYKAGVDRLEEDHVVEKGKKHVHYDTLPTITTVEQLPTLPQRPTSMPSSEAPLTYTFSWRRPLLDRPTLSMFPTSGMPIHSTVPGVPDLSQWRLNYESKYFARLHRYTTNKEQGDLPSMQMAEIKFPEFIWPGCGPTIKFEPHEEEIARRGSSHVSRTDKLMQRTGWWTTKYGVDLPVLQGARVEWRAVKSKSSTLADVEAGITARKPISLKPSDARLITVGDIVEQAKQTINDDTWTPYSTQQLVEEKSGHVIATYSRAAPWANRAGQLDISPPSAGGPASPEYVEGVLIACAAMVGMQDRIGLASSLLEASAETFAIRNKRGKKKDTSREPTQGEIQEIETPVARSTTLEKPTEKSVVLA